MKRSLLRSAGVLGLAALLSLTACNQAERAVAADPPATDASKAAATALPDETRPSFTLDVARRPLPPGVDEVLQLAESGAAEEVLRAYVETADVAYALAVDDMVYLRDIGIPSSVIAAMLKRGNELREREAAALEARAELQSAVEQLRAELATPTAEVAAAEPSPEPGTVAAEILSPAAAAAAAGQEMPAVVQQFYTELAPYGSWNFVPVYGWVWQPQIVVVNPGWRPYCHGGRWLWSDCGWYWASDYSWGWAPFHFGRWYSCPRLGWAWVPGSVWGPSWVSWRWSSGFCGWAPLPPACGWTAGVGVTWAGGSVSVGFGWGLGASCWNFVPWHSFCSPSPWRHTVGVNQSGSVFENSTVVNNIIVGNNNTIINEGLGLNRVQNLARTEVPRVAVRELPDQASRIIRADRIERTADGPVVYRPSETRFAETGRLQPVVRPAGDARTGGSAPSATAVAARSPTGNLPALTSASRPGVANATPADAPNPAGLTVPTLSRPGLQPVAPGAGAALASTRPGLVAPSAANNVLPRGTASTATARPVAEARNLTPVTQARPIGGDTRLNSPSQRTTYPMLGQAGRTPGTEARQGNPVTTASAARDPRTGQPLNVATAARPPQVAARPALSAASPAVNPRVQVEARQAAPVAAARPTVTPGAPTVTTMARPTVPQQPPPLVFSSRPEARAYGGAPVQQAAPAAAPRPMVNTPTPMAAPRPTYSAPTPAPSPAVSAPVNMARPTVSAPAPTISAPARPSAPVAAPAAGASGRAFQPR